METILCTPAFNSQWEFSHGYVGHLLPLSYDTPDGLWEYCEIAYQLLPTKSRYAHAQYDLELSVSRSPTATENNVGTIETTAEFALDSWWSDGRDYHVLFGVTDTGDRVIEHSHRHDEIIAQLDAIEDYEYLQLHIEYDEQTSREQLSERSPSELRARFEELLEEENLNPSHRQFENGGVGGSFQ